MQYAFYVIGITPYFRELQEQPLVYVQTFLKKNIFSHRLSEFTNGTTHSNNTTKNTSAHSPALKKLRKCAGLTGWGSCNAG